MCGIAGWVDFKRDLQAEQKTIEKMTETLSRRGPDDTNIWVNTHVAFGHKRLVVIDPEGGKQPMTKSKEGQRYTICYNGELYNTDELRKALLQKGYSFRGHSDTEVLLTAYIEWKEECVEKLNGIFAFAIWDEAEQKLFLARDRLGVKPLFFALTTGFLFGSELKAILANKYVRAELDREGLCEIFGLAPSRTPGSGVFKGIQELRPGHALTFSREGLKIWRYWNVKSQRHEDDLETTVEKVRFLVIDAVRRQLVSDVPLCTFLSGGLDSSAITAIAANEYALTGKGNLHTYSIDYEGNDRFFKANEYQPNSDAAFIKSMSDSFRTVHHNCVISQQELVDYLDQAVFVRDLPGMADIDSSLLWFCAQIKKNFTVSLSGECADEIFGGYPWFHRTEEFDRQIFPWMRSLEARQRLLNARWRETLNLEEYITEKYRATISEVPRLDGETTTEARRRELFYLNMVWFMTTLLDRKDRMSMGASLEVRVPFADHRLVEYVWNIPWEFKMYGNREKGILRKALAGLLPDEILYRKKSPYPKTHNPAYTEAVRKLLSSCLKDPTSPLHEFFDRAQLLALIESADASFAAPWFGQLMTGPQLLAHLVQIHIWFKKYNVNLAA